MGDKEEVRGVVEEKSGSVQSQGLQKLGYIWIWGRNGEPEVSSKV